MRVPRGCDRPLVADEDSGAGYRPRQHQRLVPASVKIGDHVTATCTVTEVIPEKRRAVLSTICKVGDTVVIEGDAMVMVPSRAK